MVINILYVFFILQSMFKVITIPSPNKNIYEVGKASIILSALQMGK